MCKFIRFYSFRTGQEMLRVGMTGSKGPQGEIEPGVAAVRTQPLYTGRSLYQLSCASLTFIDPLISEASYWLVLFISPRITVSREPDSAPFRAEIMS